MPIFWATSDQALMCASRPLHISQIRVPAVHRGFTCKAPGFSCCSSCFAAALNWGTTKATDSSHAAASTVLVKLDGTMLGVSQEGGAALIHLQPTTQAARVWVRRCMTCLHPNQAVAGGTTTCSRRSITTLSLAGCCAALLNGVWTNPCNAICCSNNR